jgi:hypothetical protein
MKDSKLTRHHIIPRSQCRGKDIPNNIVMVSHKEHDLYHQLFQNRVPEEILHYLVTVFWNGNTTFLINYLFEIEDK